MDTREAGSRKAAISRLSHETQGIPSDFRARRRLGVCSEFLLNRQSSGRTMASVMTGVNSVTLNTIPDLAKQFSKINDFTIKNILWYVTIRLLK